VVWHYVNFTPRRVSISDSKPRTRVLFKRLSTALTKCSQISTDSRVYEQNARSLQEVPSSAEGGTFDISLRLAGAGHEDPVVTDYLQSVTKEQITWPYETPLFHG
jgi:hypothetical protein